MATDGNGSINNSIILDCCFSGLENVTSNYNVYYNNVVNNSLSNGSNDYCIENSNEIDPRKNGLGYLLSVDEGCTLSHISSDDYGIGPSIVKKVGVTGTLYGETGYNTTTEDKLWPFPNENIIKSNMAKYSSDGVNGARGFCASCKQKNGIDNITLTSYIWEYLGNQIPSSIYGAEINEEIDAPTNLHNIE